MFCFQNLIRANPSALAGYLTMRLDRFGMGNCQPNDWLDEFDGQTCYATNEGKSAVLEAIDYLDTQASLPALKWSQGAALAADDHAQDNGPVAPMFMTYFSHTGNDGSS